MRTLIASTAGAGHFTPLVPFAEALVRRGDDVLVVGPPGLAPAAAAAGQRFAAGADPPADEVAEIWRRFPESSPQEAAALVNRELFGRLCTAAMAPTLERLCEQWRPDLILRDPCDYASVLAAERAGIPHAQVAISLARVEAGSLDLAAPVLEAHRRDVVERIYAAPYLTRFPRALDPSPFPRTVRYRDGGSSEGGGSESDRAAPPAPALSPRWGADDRPLLYATLGSVAPTLPLAAPAYRAILDAVADLPVRVLLTVGRETDASSLGPLPPNVHVEPWVPQADVLLHAAAVVCHGGSGTTFGTLAAGIPLVLLPLFADQPANARLVAEAGAGVVVAPPHAAAEVRAAIATVLAEASHRDAAARIAAEMRGALAVEAVLAPLA